MVGFDIFDRAARYCEKLIQIKIMEKIEQPS